MDLIKQKAKKFTDLPKEELIQGGTFTCSGCNAILSIKLLYKALGKNTIMINPAGCMTLTATYPYTPYKVPWIHGAIENAAAVGSGIYRGLKALKKDKGIHIVPFAGDGATYDIGFQSLSGAVHRKENMIFVCYNNSSYANTGFQWSAATPWGANTNTSPPGKKNPIGNILPRKHMTKMLAIQGSPYVATATPAYPLDYVNKLRKAAQFEGTKFIDCLTACIPGWNIGDPQGAEVSRAMVESGIWPLYEIVNKKFRLTHKPKMIPVEKALKMQKRFAHLKPEHVKQIQKMVDEEWKYLNKGDIWNSEEY